MLRAGKKNVRKDGGSGYRIEGGRGGGRVQAKAGGKGVGQSNTGCYTYSVRLLQGDIVLHNSMYWGLGVVRGWAFYSTCIYFVRGWTGGTLHV